MLEPEDETVNSARVALGRVCGAAASAAADDVHARDEADLGNGDSDQQYVSGYSELGGNALRRGSECGQRSCENHYLTTISIH